MFVIVVGRGSGGTRLMSQTLSASDFYTGPVNVSGDLVPAEDMYKAVRLAGERVKMLGPESWDFTGLVESNPTSEFETLVRSYLKPVLRSKHPRCGWKLPETVLAFPWIVKMFPDAYYIHWTRDRTGATKSPHTTDDMTRFGAPTRFKWPPKSFSDLLERRLESWAYHREIVSATPMPRQFLPVRYEDFVLNRELELGRISKFLGFPLQKYGSVSIRAL